MSSRQNDNEKKEEKCEEVQESWNRRRLLNNQVQKTQSQLCTNFLPLRHFSLQSSPSFLPFSSSPDSLSTPKKQIDCINLRNAKPLLHLPPRLTSTSRIPSAIIFCLPFRQVVLSEAYSQKQFNISVMQDVMRLHIHNLKQQLKSEREKTRQMKETLKNLGEKIEAFDVEGQELSQIVEAEEYKRYRMLNSAGFHEERDGYGEIDYESEGFFE